MFLVTAVFIKSVISTSIFFAISKFIVLIDSVSSKYAEITYINKQNRKEKLFCHKYFMFMYKLTALLYNLSDSYNFYLVRRKLTRQLTLSYYLAIFEKFH